MIAALLLAIAQDPAVEREWRAREWALHREHASLAAALEHPAWAERHAALDALGRTPLAARAGLQMELVAPMLQDPHPNVRAAALAVYARACATPPPEALALAGDSFASVRRALAQALSRSDPQPMGLTALLGLARGSGEVAALARRGLLSAGPSAAAEQLELIGSDTEVLMESLPYLRRAPVAPALVEGLRKVASGELARTLVEALALHAELDGAPVRADRTLLAAGWLEFRAGDYRHEVALRERLLETAREGDEKLARALFKRARGLLDGPVSDGVIAAFGSRDEAALFLAECGAQALDGAVAIQWAADLPELLAARVWSQVIPPLASIDRAAAARWLGPAVDEELRFGVASVVADHFRRTGDPTAEGLLFDLLEDADTGLRRGAFRWLCDGPDLQGRLEPLFTAWESYPLEERVLHLRALPRDTCPWPFRSGLLELCADPSRRTSSLLELLGTFKEEPEVQAALRTWLAEALVGLEGARVAAEWRAQEARAVALVHALGPGAVDELASALRCALTSAPSLSSGDQHDPELSKACCALLGRSRAGRAELADHLGVEVESRARIEAAIQLLGPEDSLALQGPATRALVECFVRCDPELGGRVLRALGRAREGVGGQLLFEVVVDPGRGLDLRRAAVEALLERGDVSRLRAAFAAAKGPDVGAVLASALAKTGEATAIADLRRAWLLSGEKLDATGGQDPYERHRTGELLVAVALADALEEGELGLVLGATVAGAGEDLAGRFRAERTAATAFRWHAELRACEIAASRGDLWAWLEAAGPWWRLDGDLLASLAEVARGAGDLELAHRLLEAAEVATVGEAISEGWWNRRARIALGGLQVTTDLGQTAEVGLRSAALWGDLRLLDRRIAAWEDALGRFDRRAGVDPVANLDAGRLQARSWLALSQDDLPRARSLASEAALRVGASLPAREVQALLEAALDR